VISVANLLEASGHQVFRDNHLGDWGTQFGKQIVAIKNGATKTRLLQLIIQLKN
jgi:arginyl-tRNA synthetase